MLNIPTKYGILCLVLCVLCYILSGVAFVKNVKEEQFNFYFVIFFGAAKTFQYTAIAILGVEAWKRIKSKLGFGTRKSKKKI